MTLTPLDAGFSPYSSPILVPSLTQVFERSANSGRRPRYSRHMHRELLRSWNRGSFSVRPTTRMGVQDPVFECPNGGVGRGMSLRSVRDSDLRCCSGFGAYLWQS